MGKKIFPFNTIIIIYLTLGVLYSCQREKAQKGKTVTRGSGAKTVKKGTTVSLFGLLASPTGKLKGYYYKDKNSKKYYAYVNGKEYGPFDGYAKGGDEHPYLIVYNKIEGAKRGIFGKPRNYTVFVEGEKYEFKNLPVSPLVVLYKNTGTYWLEYSSKGKIHFIINGKEITYDRKGFSSLMPNVSRNGKSWGFVAHRSLKKEWWAVINGKEYLHHKSIIQPSNLVFSYDGSKWWWVIFDKKIWLCENGEKKEVIGLKMKNFSSTLTKFDLYVSDNGNNKVLVVRQFPRMELWVNGKSYGMYEISNLTMVDVKVFDNFWGAVIEDRKGGKMKKYVIINGKKYGPYSYVDNFTVSENGERWGFVFKKKGKKGRFIMIDGKEYGPYYYIEGPVFSPDGSKWAFAVKDRKDKTVSFRLYINEKEVFKKKFENVRFTTPYSVGDLYIDKKGRIVGSYTTDKEAVLLIDGKEEGSFPRSLRYRVSGEKVIYAYLTKEKLVFGEK